LPSEPLIVETDPRRLERILANLLDNAREHGDAAGVEVALEATVEVVVLAVADRGPGVPSDRLGQIFDRFYKADPSRAAGGSGLGLAIAAEHAALLGAELRATNRDGGGLLIELRLPVTGSLRGGDLPAIGGSDRGVTPIAASEPTT
jgi:two-component system sensor histidine kinase MtrB